MRSRIRNLLTVQSDGQCCSKLLFSEIIQNFNILVFNVNIAEICLVDRVFLEKQLGRMYWKILYRES